MKIFLDAVSRTPTVSIGTQALIIGSLEIVAKHFEDATFVMLSAYPELEKYYCDKERFKIELVKRSPGQMGTIRDITGIIKRVDAIVSTWGDGYITTPPHKILNKTIFFNIPCKKPSVLFTASIGPFTGSIKQFFAKKGLSQFDVLTVRDTVTFDYLRNLGLKNLHLLPDTAYALEPVGTERTKEILKGEGTPADQKYIGLNISQLLNYLCAQSNVYEYPKLMAEVADYLVDTFKLPVVLIPHQIYPETFPVADTSVYESLDGDDRVAVREVIKYVKNKDAVFPILGEYTAREYKGIISLSDIFIGGRMHTVIGATSTCVPSVIIQYSHKALGVMNMLGLNDYVWDFKAPKEGLFRKIDQVWESRDKIRKGLVKKMGNIKRDVFTPGALLKDLIK